MVRVGRFSGQRSGQANPAGCVSFLAPSVGFGPPTGMPAMSHSLPFGEADPPPREPHYPTEPVRVSDDHVRDLCRLAETWLRVWDQQIIEPIKLSSGTVVSNRM